MVDPDDDSIQSTSIFIVTQDAVARQKNDHGNDACGPSERGDDGYAPCALGARSVSHRGEQFPERPRDKADEREAAANDERAPNPAGIDVSAISHRLIGGIDHQEKERRGKVPRALSGLLLGAAEPQIRTKPGGIRAPVRTPQPQ
mgnify:CR=1 FL=1